MYWKTIWFHPRATARDAQNKFKFRHLVYLLILLDVLIPFATGLFWTIPLFENLIICVTSLVMLFGAVFLYAIIQKLLIVICRGHVKYMSIIKVLCMASIFTIIQEILSMFFALDVLGRVPGFVGDIAWILSIVVGVWGAINLLLMFSEISRVSFWWLLLANFITFLIIGGVISIAVSLVVLFVKLMILYVFPLISNYGIH
ncbi:MAG: hypothetical protein NTX05_03040 [Fusobacteria bacterium]|nr:hypothetical protein [Fusobacteriota bacterium]